MRRALVLLALVAAGMARAVAFSLAPTVLEIDPDRRTTAETRLVNADTTALTFTVEVMRWENVNGQDVYTPTRDVLVNPARFTLAPLGKQVIRVGLQKRVGAGELTYRVFIRQQPGPQPPGAGPAPAPAAGGGRGGHQLREPAQHQPAHLRRARQRRAEAGLHGGGAGADLRLHIQNAGNRHFTFRQLSIVSDTGQTFVLPSKAVLAGGTATLLLPRFGGARLLRMTTYDAQGQALYDELKLP